MYKVFYNLVYFLCVYIFVVLHKNVVSVYIAKKNSISVIIHFELQFQFSLAVFDNSVFYLKKIIYPLEGTLSK